MHARRGNMPRKQPENAEPLILSPDDEFLLDRFVIRRSFGKDGAIRYVQAVGNAQEIEAAAYDDDIQDRDSGSRVQVAYSLPRLIARRMRGGADLEPEEVVTPRNGKRGDLRRENTEVRSRGEAASGERPTRSSTGVKGVYWHSSGRPFVNYNGVYLGTYDTVEEAKGAIEAYDALLADGVDKVAAAKTVKRQAKLPAQNADLN
jgi:hypothetical protein